MPPTPNASLLEALRARPFEDLGFARVDHHRAVRQGFPEVVLGLGKTPPQIAAIAADIVARGSTLLVTRATEDAFDAVRDVVPHAAYHADARVIALRQGDVAPGSGSILIVAAGTSDLPVAEEAALHSRADGQRDRPSLRRRRRRVCIGCWANAPASKRARVIIVVAGMEGALPSVVAGLVAVPVIAVPTSVGYGASFGGIAALLGMLNSCASGVVGREHRQRLRRGVDRQPYQSLIGRRVEER